MTYQERTVDPEQGANLVEFAVLAPLLIILVLGIVEFGWLFGQNNSVRHAAREASRYASVSGGGTTTNDDIAQRACNDLLGSGGIQSLTVEIDDGGGDFGDDGSVEVIIEVQSLTGAPLISSFVPATVSSKATFRLEQDASGWSTATTTFPDATDCSTMVTT